MKNSCPWRIAVLLTLTALLLTFSFTNTTSLALAAEDDSAASEPVLSPEYLDFFGPDGLDQCLQPETLTGYIDLLESNGLTQLVCSGNILDGLTLDDLYHFHTLGFSLHDLIQTAISRATYSQEQAVLTTVWETVGTGRINRKYLNGMVAFCFDEELKFPNGALYSYATASNAVITGQAAAIAQRYGASGVDNAQWWNECQVAIWAVQAGCIDRSSAESFARSYCADRGIRDTDTIADYVHVVGSLVEESRGQSGTAYLYQAVDPANQRILTFSPVWPNPAPTYPSPRYDQVSVTESYTATRTHSLSITSKYAAVTGELLLGAVFEIYENDALVGTITTDAQGAGTCSWTLSIPDSSTITKEYCANYDQLDPATRATITGYTNRDDAYAAAQAEAQAIAREQAEALADSPHVVTIREITVPAGFSRSTTPAPSITLAGDDSASVSIENIPWRASFLLDKVDGITGQRIGGETTFTLYEWNGSDYEVSPHYHMIRLEDGTYTSSASYPDSEIGYLYYTQTNEGRFALAETQAPHGYVQDTNWSYFQITEDQQVIQGHNAIPGDYPICDDTKFANLPVTGVIRIQKQGEYLTGIQPAIYTDGAACHTTFQYTLAPVEGTSFSIYAAEDILSPDGSGRPASYDGILLTKDALVATVFTDADGLAQVEGLPLGTYLIRETNVGQGEFLLNPTIFEVTLSYEDQNTAVILSDPISCHNQRQQISVSLTKNDSHQKTPLAGAVYGLYAAKDIYGYAFDEETGALIPTDTPLITADTLIECVITDTDGTAIFCSDLPHGSYYVREQVPPKGYLLCEDSCSLDAGYTGPDGEACLSFELTFYNDPVPVPPTPTDPGVPSSSGAPTGDDQPLSLCCLSLLGSLFVLFLLTIRDRYVIFSSL